MAWASNIWTNKDILVSNYGHSREILNIKTEINIRYSKSFSMQNDWKN